MYHAVLVYSMPDSALRKEELLPDERIDIYKSFVSSCIMYIHSKLKNKIRELSQRGQMSGPLALLFRICTVQEKGRLLIDI